MSSLCLQEKKIIQVSIVSRFLNLDLVTCACCPGNTQTVSRVAVATAEECVYFNIRSVFNMILKFREVY